MKKLFFAMMLLALGTVNVEALEVKENITLEQDYDEIIIVDGDTVTTTDKTVVIDLNGHSITYASQPKMNEPTLLVKNGAKVTIKGEGTIESTNYNGITVQTGSTVTLESGTVKAVEFGALVTGDSTFTMNGGTIVTSDNCGVGGNGSNKAEYKDYTININGGTITSNITSAGYVSCGVYHPNTGTVNINGGIINSTNGAGVVQRGGTLNIKGGVINTAEKTKDIIGKVGDSRVVVPASAVVVDRNSQYPAYQTIQTNITGTPIFNGVNKDLTTLGDVSNLTITGGVFTTKVDETLLAEGYKYFDVVDGENKNKFAVSKPTELKNEIIEGMVSEEDLTEETVNLIKDAIKGQYELASYYDIQLVTVPAEDIIVGNVTESDKPVKVTVGIPTNLPKLKDNFVRKYIIIRIHDGKVTIIDDVTVNADGTLSFETDKFSTYALAYKDEEKQEETTTETTGTTVTTKEEVKTNNPKTADSILIYTAILSISVIGLGASAYKYKHNQ